MDGRMTDERKHKQVLRLCRMYASACWRANRLRRVLVTLVDGNGEDHDEGAEAAERAAGVRRHDDG